MGKQNGRERKIKFTTMRLTPELKERIRSQAEKNRRTIGAEIEVLIELGLEASLAK